MKLYQAQIEEFNAILAFYDDVIAHTPEISLYARWSKGKHPTSISLSSDKIINQLTINNNDNERNKIPYPIRFQHHRTVHP